MSYIPQTIGDLQDFYDQQPVGFHYELIRDKPNRSCLASLPEFSFPAEKDGFCSLFFFEWCPSDCYERGGQCLRPADHRLRTIYDYFH